MSSWTTDIADDEEVVTQKRLQNFVFTINNYTDAHIRACEEFECTYIVYGKEVGAKNGTAHLQGYVETRNGYTLRAIRKHFLEKIWVAKRRGTAEQAAEYCKKEHDFVERGKMKPGQGKRTDLSNILECINNGMSDRDIVYELHSTQAALAVPKIRSMMIEPRDDTVQPIIHWYWGDSGAGKTTTARKEAKEKYGDYDEITFYGGFASGYTGRQKAVIIDDIRPGNLPYEKLLNLLDSGSKTRVNVKFGDMLWNPLEIWCTCPWDTKEFTLQYNTQHKTQENSYQLTRRCGENVKHFKISAKKAPRSRVGNIRATRQTSDPEFTFDGLEDAIH